ncbi:DUF4123 domain-containing protein [Glaciimonas soli]|uniref:DUF4123 domain-containing protein n=1 Tax=Glaciimonas soli TaxID=2590999 RepID=A0A843YKA5_9BURK|nr:DUF4123 domain-containing protein [Glaciimonas soli]MQR00239.1 DUF4123 domain-containing protein [Glaciimonas soli]
MYHGVDPHHPELQSQIVTAISNTIAEHEAQQGKLHAYALVDGVYDKALGLQLWENSQQSDTGVVSLYGDSSISGYEEVSPFLIRLGKNNLPQLLAYGQGKPMLSFLQTPLSLTALQRHFAPFLQVHTPSDRLRFVIRFADTLNTLNILETLSETQLEAFRFGFTAWHVINRKGTLTTIAGTYVDAASYAATEIGEANAIDITNRQYGRLVADTEADTILCSLAEEAQQLIKGRKASVLYNMISNLLGEMTLRGINSEPERYALMMKAITFSDRTYALELLDQAQKIGVEAALRRSSAP